ncbi:MAG: hypothetical protein JWQ62_33 [Lacunisphaera sp.]|nr:hypothetical protein [Lacunisphaera sp.]
MGGDRRMYPGPWQKLPGAKFIEWPDYAGESSVEEVAARIVSLHGIPDGSTVVGSSLGGMVGCEIARLRTLREVVLVGSALHQEEINPFCARIHPLIDYLPLRLAQRVAGSLPGELLRMFSDADPHFIRAMCRAIFKWRGAAGLNTPVRRIHGRRDHIISRPASADLFVSGRHVIAMTNAEECVAFLTGGRSSNLRQI